MASIITNPRIGRQILSTAGGILARLGLTAFAAPRTATGVSPDQAFRGVLAGSGGKFTDSLERNADLRLRDNSAWF
jgi:hypothetical protein